MNPDTASTRVPVQDDPDAPIGTDRPSSTAASAPADDLTIGGDPLRSPSDPEPGVGAGASRSTASASSPTEDLYTPPTGGSYGAPTGGFSGAPSGSAYGPPPPYGQDAYASGQADYTSAPYAPPMAPPTDRRKRRQHWAGAILVILGLLFLGNNLGLLFWIEPEYLLPLILVGAGAWLLFGRGRRG
jgi:hypothetical protein